MSLCVRYVKGLNIFERFLGFVDVSEKQDSQTLAETILNFLSQLNLHSVPIIAQSYDGARVMSGCKNGVHVKIQSKHPFAMYTHCMARRMNLVVLDLCKNIEVFKKLIKIVHCSLGTYIITLYFLVFKHFF